jgi:hypothetical protein
MPESVQVFSHTDARKCRERCALTGNELDIRLPMSFMSVQTARILRHIFTYREVLPLIAGVEKLTGEAVSWDKPLCRANDQPDAE